MNQWLTLYRKELLEMWRNSKWIWVPLVFIIIGVQQPIVTYYTPQIIQSVGGLPDGTIIQIPVPSAIEVLIATLSQYGSLGILILVLASMGIIASERQSGVASLIVVRPVPHASYITAKWAALLSLIVVSFFCGYIAAWYYTEMLFAKVDFSAVIGSFALYGLWLAFVATLTVLMSSWLRSNGAIAFVTIAIAAVLSIATNLFGKYMKWSPARLSDHAAAFMNGATETDLVLCLVCSLLIIIGLLLFSIYIFKRKPEI